MIPTCNGMMRNIYPSTSRPYPYPTHNFATGGVNSMSRYPQMNTSYPPVAQFSGMPSTMGGMSTGQMGMAPPPHQQVQRLPMTSEYNVNLVSGQVKVAFYRWYVMIIMCVAAC